MIYTPKRIKVGFQNHNDTYTGKLAYIIYYDEYNKLKKRKLDSLEKKLTALLSDIKQTELAIDSLENELLN